MFSMNVPRAEFDAIRIEELMNSQQREESFASPCSDIRMSRENSKNDVICVNPSNLEFAFSATDLKPQEKTINIVNYSSRPCIIQLIPPVTQYFLLRHSNLKHYLYGGAVLKVKIVFTPDDVRDYSDDLQIRCSSGENLSINISAILLTQLNFPAKINFGNVPLEQTACVVIPIDSLPNARFAFAILTSREDPSIDIYPRFGSVYPGQKPVELFVIYRPLRYITLNVDIRIFVTELCKTPYSINIQAYTRPGLQREKIEIIHETREHDDKDPCSEDKTGHVRNVLRTEKTEDASGKKDSVRRKLENIPLYTMHTVNCILNARDDKFHGQHELLGPFNSYILQLAKEKLICRKLFLSKVSEYRRENNAAMVHHKEKVGVGTGTIDDNVFNAILLERQQAWINYTESIITTPDAETYNRGHYVKIRKRILREALHHPKTMPYINSDEELFSIPGGTFRFINAARIIVLQIRLINVLEILKRLTPDIIERLERLVDKERQHSIRQEIEVRKREAKQTLKSGL